MGAGVVSILRNLWLPSIQRRQELLSSAYARVYKLYTAALYANQTSQHVATQLVASCTVDLRTTQTYWQLCSGLPRNQACSSHLVEFCKYTEVPSDAWVTSTEPEELSILREPEELLILREVARIGVNNIESSKSRS